jgi:hypothetical protein
MNRYKNIGIEVSNQGFRAELTNAEEEREIPWTGGRCYRASHVAGFYEILRSVKTGLPIGVELHLGARPKLDAILQDMYGFSQFERFANSDKVWQFRFVQDERDEGYIDWEQIVSDNPFIGENGILLHIALWHLPDEQYEVFAGIDFMVEGKKS